MESLGLGHVAIILVVLASMPLLAWCCVACVNQRERRAVEAIERGQIEAEQRAQLLLRDVLTGEELRQFMADRHLLVPSRNVAGRNYRVYPSAERPVEVYESGVLVAGLCLQPLQRLPVSDLVVMHKLMIEGHEAGYLRESNVVRSRGAASGGQLGPGGRPVARRRGMAYACRAYAHNPAGRVCLAGCENGRDMSSGLAHSYGR